MRWRWVALGAAWLALGGCTGPRAAPRLEWVADRERLIDERIAAIREFSDPAAPSWDAVRESLKDIVFRLGDPEALRIAAIQALAGDVEHETNTIAMLRRVVPLESAYANWTVIAAVGEVAAARGWTELAPAFVDSWAREDPRIRDDARAERAAVIKLVPNADPFEVAFGAVASGGYEPLDDERRDRVFALLNRLDPDGTRRRALLASLDPGSAEPLFAALADAGRALGQLPRTPEQLRWFRALWTDHRASFDRALSLAQAFGDATVAELSLTHLPALLYCEAEHQHRLRADLAALLASANVRLERREHHFRRVGAIATGRRELIRDWTREMDAGDLLLLLTALDAVDDASVRGELFRQADADLRDRSTEFGGLVRWLADERRFVFVSYPPRGDERFGDDRFVASPEMIRDQPLALFHYHLQAQRIDNARHAGPSSGDIEYARVHGRACIVLTRVGERTLNADLYMPDGVRFDLGEIVRGPAGAGG